MILFSVSTGSKTDNENENYHYLPRNSEEVFLTFLLNRMLENVIYSHVSDNKVEN